LDPSLSGLGSPDGVEEQRRHEYIKVIFTCGSSLVMVEGMQGGTSMSDAPEDQSSLVSKIADQSEIEMRVFALMGEMDRTWQGASLKRRKAFIRLQGEAARLREHCNVLYENTHDHEQENKLTRLLYIAMTEVGPDEEDDVGASSADKVVNDITISVASFRTFRRARSEDI